MEHAQCRQCQTVPSPRHSELIVCCNVKQMFLPLSNYPGKIVDIFQKMKPLLRGLKIFGAGAGCLMTGSYINYSIQDSRKIRLPVANVPLPEARVGGVNLIPMIKTCFGLLPTALRERVLMSAAAPKEADIPRDKWDLRHQSPYVLEQVRARRRREGEIS